MAERVLADAPPTFALAGHSMGGRVALEVVRRAPGRVERLALLDTGCRARPPGAAGDGERAGRLALLASAREHGMRAMARTWVQPMVHPERLADAALIDAIVAMFARRTPQQFAGQIEALLARPDATDVLRAVACPALVLCGREDGWAPPSQHEEMAALMPGAGWRSSTAAATWRRWSGPTRSGRRWSNGSRRRRWRTRRMSSARADRRGPTRDVAICWARAMSACDSIASITHEGGPHEEPIL